MDKIKTLIDEVEKLKQEEKFEKATKMLEKSISKYHDDHRLYEELADIYLYEWKLPW